MKLLASALFLVAVLSACSNSSSPPATSPGQSPRSVQATPAAPTAPPAATATTEPTAPPVSTPKCTIRGPLPDPVCTPGATDPRVTQANIQSTICVVGYTDTVRPPSSYTTNLKITQMQEYGLTLTVGEVEEDHLIPLELGGDPMDPKNLWPEPYGGESDGARDQDQVENELHRAVCDGAIGLAEAQSLIAEDWTTALSSLPAKQETAPPPPPPAAVPPPPPPPPASTCDPNYSGGTDTATGGCIRSGVGDYDCAGGGGNGPNYVKGPVRVVGTDVYGLDSDHDGVACER